MQSVAGQLRGGGKRIGLVPTMGYLHEGHLSLIRIARENADTVIVTLFVNPAQFAPHEDLATYPRDFERDARLVEGEGADILFAPDAGEMYPPGYLTYVGVESLTDRLEGSVRPTHFRGVTTIVTKLFHCTSPHVAVFGQKDAQQAIVLRKMVEDLDFGIRMIIAPIVRESDGLAMSSRNVYLSPEERSQSRVLNRSLTLAESLIRSGERSSERIIGAMKSLIEEQSLSRIDYISVADAASLQELALLPQGSTVLISLAVRFGRTRLIDNTIVALP
jgi:pantoate--beta-alanine ligase